MNSIRLQELEKSMNHDNFEKLVKLGTRVTIEHRNRNGEFTYLKGEVVKVVRDLMNPFDSRESSYHVKFNENGVASTYIYDGRRFFKYSEGLNFNIVSIEVKNKFEELVSVPSERLLEIC